MKSSYFPLYPGKTHRRHEFLSSNDPNKQPFSIDQIPFNLETEQFSWRILSKDASKVGIFSGVHSFDIGHLSKTWRRYIWPLEEEGREEQEQEPLPSYQTLLQQQNNNNPSTPTFTQLARHFIKVSQESDKFVDLYEVVLIEMYDADDDSNTPTKLLIVFIGEDARTKFQARGCTGDVGSILTQTDAFEPQFFPRQLSLIMNHCVSALSSYYSTFYERTNLFLPHAELESGKSFFLDLETGNVRLQLSPRTLGLLFVDPSNEKYAAERMKAKFPKLENDMRNLRKFVEDVCKSHENRMMETSRFFYLFEEGIKYLFPAHKGYLTLDPKVGVTGALARVNYLKGLIPEVGFDDLRKHAAFLGQTLLATHPTWSLCKKAGTAFLKNPSFKSSTSSSSTVLDPSGNNNNSQTNNNRGITSEDLARQALWFQENIKNKNSSSSTALGSGGTKEKAVHLIDMTTTAAQGNTSPTNGLADDRRGSVHSAGLARSAEAASSTGGDWQNNLFSHMQESGPMKRERLRKEYYFSDDDVNESEQQQEEQEQLNHLFSLAPVEIEMATTGSVCCNQFARLFDSTSFFSSKDSSNAASLQTQLQSLTQKSMSKVRRDVKDGNIHYDKCQSYEDQSLHFVDFGPRVEQLIAGVFLPPLPPIAKYSLVSGTAVDGSRSSLNNSERHSTSFLNTVRFIGDRLSNRFFALKEFHSVWKRENEAFVMNYLTSIGVADKSKKKDGGAIVVPGNAASIVYGAYEVFSDDDKFPEIKGTIEPEHLMKNKKEHCEKTKKFEAELRDRAKKMIDREIRDRKKKSSEHEANQQQEIFDRSKCSFHELLIDETAPTTTAILSMITCKPQVDRGRLYQNIYALLKKDASLYEQSMTPVTTGPQRCDPKTGFAPSYSSSRKAASSSAPARSALIFPVPRGFSPVELDSHRVLGHLRNRENDILAAATGLDGTNSCSSLYFLPELTSTQLKCLLFRMLMQLDYLHSVAGVIHCNVRRENYFLESNSWLNFGCSIVVSEEQKGQIYDAEKLELPPDQFVEFPSHSLQAPEISNNKMKKISAKIDIFAFGLLMLQCLIPQFEGLTSVLRHDLIVGSLEEEIGDEKEIQGEGLNLRNEVLRRFKNQDRKIRYKDLLIMNACAKKSSSLEEAKPDKKTKNCTSEVKLAIFIHPSKEDDADEQIETVPEEASSVTEQQSKSPTSSPVAKTAPTNNKLVVNASDYFNSDIDAEELFAASRPFVLVNPFDDDKESNNRQLFQQVLVESAIKAHNVLFESKREIREILHLIEKCLQQDPKLRPTARELMNDPIFEDVKRRFFHL